ncbi:MAG: dTDP-4-dehydrorhamnose 3,5-epimerase family protein [Planctomycetia bacterium]|nr:dTDP-4-dehydrorhamnose 3,5-epimerase family protein [Planctomycetia bacterium]
MEDRANRRRRDAAHAASAPRGRHARRGGQGGLARVRSADRSGPLPGRVRPWGLHQRSTDRLFVVSGLVSIVVFDGRTASPTFGAINEFKVSDRNPTLLVIPPDLYHGWKNIGTSEAFVINMPTVQYDYENPDALDLPYDAPAAAEIVPYRW